jgi:hypothetical protein
MIKLKELLSHFHQEEEDKGLVPVDNWSATHAMFFEDMGFKNDGVYHYALKRPEMRLSYKKGVGFVLEDRSKSKRNEENYDNLKEVKPIVSTFQKFKQLEEYFMNYKQKFDDKPYSVNVSNNKL